MVTVLKQRLALAVLLGVLAIPVVSVNNAGLTHLLFCQAEVRQPFAVGTAEDGGSEITSSTSLDRDDEPATDESTTTTEICEGVRVDFSGVPISDGEVEFTITIVNDSPYTWRGSVGLDTEGPGGDADLTTALGEVPSGEQASTTLQVQVHPGQTEIGGTLLLGP